MLPMVKFEDIKPGQVIMYCGYNYLVLDIGGKHNCVCLSTLRLKTVEPDERVCIVGVLLIKHTEYTEVPLIQ